MGPRGCAVLFLTHCHTRCCHLLDEHLSRGKFFKMSAVPIFSFGIFSDSVTVVLMCFLFTCSVTRRVPPAYQGRSLPAAISPPCFFDSLWLRYSSVHILMSSCTSSTNCHQGSVRAGVRTVLKGLYSTSHTGNETSSGETFCHCVLKIPSTKYSCCP